jgi:hypothetical protein
MLLKTGAEDIVTFTIRSKSSRLTNWERTKMKKTLTITVKRKNIRLRRILSRKRNTLNLTFKIT